MLTDKAFPHGDILLESIPSGGHIEEGFNLLSDEHLSRVLPSLFVPEGEALFTILLGNLEHLIKHKYQLFVYLKMLGLAVTTPDLYRLRGRTS